MQEPRDIRLRIRLRGGYEYALTLREDAPELMALFTALALPSRGADFVQLPLEGGKAAFSLRTSELVSIDSEPPVVLELPAQAAHASTTTSAALVRPRFQVIDDFLAPREHRELLALALASQDRFTTGTTVSHDPEYRQNLVIMDFGASVHAQLIQSRLLVWFPILVKAFGLPVFPLAMIESQLTAAGAHQFYKVHSDSGENLARALSCVYYLNREPRGFSGGELRIYDGLEERGSRRAAGTFTTVEPKNNRMVVFPSEEFHEVMPVRCPSGDFADYRFAVTTWLYRGVSSDPEATFGFGHFRCGVVPPHFGSADGITA
jgi:Rps23 Pro-64 3,4-dihydroxylase Tpa1-like proline 4-hydroxylase